MTKGDNATRGVTGLKEKISQVNEKLLPAVFSHDIGSEMQRPFAVVIVDGVVSAPLFTFLLLPLAYPYFHERAAGIIPPSSP
jgi:hypothetical protein